MDPTISLLTFSTAVAAHIRRSLWAIGSRVALLVANMAGAFEHSRFGALGLGMAIMI
jgi:hypothetical protein